MGIEPSLNNTIVNYNLAFKKGTNYFTYPKKI